MAEKFSTEIKEKEKNCQEKDEKLKQKRTHTQENIIVHIAKKTNLHTLHLTSKHTNITCNEILKAKIHFTTQIHILTADGII